MPQVRAQELLGRGPSPRGQSTCSKGQTRPWRWQSKEWSSTVLPLSPLDLVHSRPHSITSLLQHVCSDNCRPEHHATSTLLHHVALNDFQVGLHAARSLHAAVCVACSILRSMFIKCGKCLPCRRPPCKFCWSRHH